MSKPIRLFRSELTGSIYAATAYKEHPDGLIEVTGKKHDVTVDFRALAGETLLPELVHENAHLRAALSTIATASEWADHGSSELEAVARDALAEVTK